MINQTLSDPEVPRGGTIRETVMWEGLVPGIASHNFNVISVYGVGTTVEEILANVVAENFVTESVVGPGQSLQSNIDTPIAENVPLGTYSCVTLIVDTVTGEEYDAKIDANVLTITPGLGATIISTSFSSV